MSQAQPTPEEVISEMSNEEVRELLSDLSMDATVEAAVRMKRLVQQLGQFEAAMEAIGGPPSMRDAA